MFLAVYNLRNLTKAAEREHIAPSAISKRLQDLEIELGATLFYRHTRGVTPTPAGEVLAGHVYRLFDDVNRMSAELSEYASGVRGQVRIHAHTSAMVEFLPDDIASFVGIYPEVRVALREETSPNVLQSTLDGVADIGVFAGNLAVPAGLQGQPYRRDRLMAVFPAGHALAGAQSIAFAQIRDSELISLESGSSLQVLLAREAVSQGFALNIRMEVTTFESALRMVDVGLGVAIIPEGVVQIYGARVNARAVPLQDDWAERELMICVRDEEKLTAAARLMLRHLLGAPAGPCAETAKPLLPKR